MTTVSCNDQPWTVPKSCRWHCILTLSDLDRYGEFTAASLRLETPNLTVKLEIYPSELEGDGVCSSINSHCTSMYWPRGVQNALVYPEKGMIMSWSAWGMMNFLTLLKFNRCHELLTRCKWNKTLVLQPSNNNGRMCVELPGKFSYIFLTQRGSC